MALRLRRTPGLSSLSIRDFSGGLNLRDAAVELAENESPDLYNVTLDERGGVGARLGYTAYNPTRYQAALVSNVFYWQTGQNLIVQCGAKLYKDLSTTSFKTFTTSARVGFADFAGTLCIIHPVDGFFTYDGTTVTAIGAGPKGDSLAPWQNKLWSNDKTGGNPSRLNFCAAADPTSWPVVNFIDVREKDNEQVVCLGVPGASKQPTGPALLAFKKRSFYRVYDSTSGSYQTVDPSVGACSALAVVSLYGRTVVLSERGIFETDGASPLKAVGARLEPLWDPTQINFAHLDLACAGTKGDRVYFSLPTVTATANDLMLEYHPLQGWITMNSNAASCYTTYGKDDQALLTGAPASDGTVYRQLSGVDDGVGHFDSYFQTRWFEPAGGTKARVRRMRIRARGDFSSYTRKDYETGQGLLRPVTIRRAGFVWNAANTNWNDPSVVWGPGSLADHQDVFSLGSARAFSFRFGLSISDITVQLAAGGGPQLFTGGNPIAPTVYGPWAVYGLDLSFVPLGLS